MILDDMWKIGDWESLKPAFPLHKAGSKILLTTRIQAVASHADPLQGFLYQPGLLSEEKSWELLRTKAFPRDDRRGIFQHTQKHFLLFSFPIRFHSYDIGLSLC